MHGSNILTMEYFVHACDIATHQLEKWWHEFHSASTLVLESSCYGALTYLHGRILTVFTSWLDLLTVLWGPDAVSGITNSGEVGTEVKQFQSTAPGR